MSETPTRRVLLSTDELCGAISGYVRQLYGNAPGTWEAIVDASNGTRITINWTNIGPRAEGDDAVPKGALRLVKSDT